MKKLNEYFIVSDDTEYELTADTNLLIFKGAGRAIRRGAVVQACGTGTVAQAGMPGTIAKAVVPGAIAEAWRAGAIAESFIHGAVAKALVAGAVAIDFDSADVMASDGNSTLRTCQGRFKAGYTEWLTREEALGWWNREDDRALLFTLAILSCDWGK